CEKPLALDVPGADELADLARAAGVLAVVCQNYRFLPLVAELAGRVAAGELGRPHLVRGSYLQDWLLLEGNTAWRLDPARGDLALRAEGRALAGRTGRRRDHHHAGRRPPIARGARARDADGRAQRGAAQPHRGGVRRARRRALAGAAPDLRRRPAARAFRGGRARK